MMNEDNPILSILAGLVRYALMVLLGTLIQRGFLTSGQVTKAALVIALALAGVILMIARKIKTYFQLKAALRLPPTATLADVKVQAKADNPLPNIVS